jgi:hypothetical protein
MMFANNWICENQKFWITLDNDSNNDIITIVQVREACKHVCLKQKKNSKYQGVLASYI